MISKISVLVGSLVALCSSSIAQPIVFPQDSPFFYNPEAGFSTVDFNGGGLFDFDCGVQFNGWSTGYTMRVPNDMDRAFMIPFNMPADGIDTICNGSFEGGSGDVLMYVPSPVPYYNHWQTSQYNYYASLINHNVRSNVNDAVDIIFEETESLTPRTPGLVFDSLSLIDLSCETYPPVSPTNSFVYEDCSEIFGCYQDDFSVQMSVFGQEACDIEALITPQGPESPSGYIVPSGWDANDDHDDTFITFPSGLPSEFSDAVILYQNRMKAVANNFWVQQNDGTMYFFAAQNRLKFTRLSWDLLIEDLEDAYTAWYNAQP